MCKNEFHTQFVSCSQTVQYLVSYHFFTSVSSIQFQQKANVKKLQKVRTQEYSKYGTNLW